MSTLSCVYFIITIFREVFITLVTISSVLLSPTHSLPRPRQTRRFWGVFVNTFEQFIWKYGIMKDFPMKVHLGVVTRV